MNTHAHFFKCLLIDVWAKIHKPYIQYIWMSMIAHGKAGTLIYSGSETGKSGMGNLLRRWSMAAL